MNILKSKKLIISPIVLIVLAGVILLTACPTEPTYYAVAYSLNSGEGNPPVDSSNYVNGDSVTVLDQSDNMSNTNTTVSFAGWCSTADGTGELYQAGDTYTINGEDVVLYAIWSTPRTITFYSEDTLYSTIEGFDGFTIDMPQDPSRSGYSFSAWFDVNPYDSTADFSEAVEWEEDSTIVDGDAILYAQWGHEVVLLKNNNSAVGEAMDSIVIGEYSAKLLPECSYSMEGYTFAGWASTATADTVEYPDEGEYAMGEQTSDVVLYAVWTWGNLEELSAEGYLELVSISGSTGYQYVQATSISDDNSTDIGFPHNISDFQIGKYEVVYELWYTVRSWAEANGYSFDYLGREGSDSTTGVEPATEDPEPASFMKWNDCIVFCNAYSEMMGLTPCYYTDATQTEIVTSYSDAYIGSYPEDYVDWTADGYRLPTEGEWQYAASCGGEYLYNYVSGAETYYNDTNDNYSWVNGDWEGISNSVADNKDANDAVAVYKTSLDTDGSTRIDNDAVTGTAVAGSKSPNSWDLYDMSGNLYEYCWDFTGSLPSSSEVKTDYRGGISGYRILKGGYYGSWYSNIYVGARATTNVISNSGDYPKMGFRLAQNTSASE